MKKFLFMIFTPFLILAFFYTVFSVSLREFQPDYWTQEMRGMFATISAFFIFMADLVIYFSVDNKNLSEP